MINSANNANQNSYLPNDIIREMIIPHSSLTNDKLYGPCISRDMQSWSCVSQHCHQAVLDILANWKKDPATKKYHITLNKAVPDETQHIRGIHNSDGINFEKIKNSLVTLNLCKCSGIEFPDELPNLQTLLLWIVQVRFLPKMECLTRLEAPLCRQLKSIPEGLSNLKILTIFHARSLKEIPELPLLEYLTAYQCINLEVIKGKMPFLRSLIAYYNPKLKALPDELSLVERIDVHGCRSLKIIGSNMNRLRKLDASNCPNLVAILSGIALITLDCYKSPKLKTIYHEMPLLKIFRCYKTHITSFPEKLDALVKLICHTCPGLIMLSASMQSLEYLDFSRCWNLKKMPSALPSLKTLIGFASQKLTYLSDHLPNLTELNISYSPNFKALPPGLTNLIKLNSNGCRDLSTLPQDLFKLESFKGGGKNFEVLPLLPSLTSLELGKSPRLRPFEIMPNLLNLTIDFTFDKSVTKCAPNIYCSNYSDRPRISASMIKKYTLNKIDEEILLIKWLISIEDQGLRTWWCVSAMQGRCTAKGWNANAFKDIYQRIYRILRETHKPKIDNMPIGLTPDVSYDPDDVNDTEDFSHQDQSIIEVDGDIMKESSSISNKRQYTEQDWLDASFAYIQAHVPAELRDASTQELQEKIADLTINRAEALIQMKQNREDLNLANYSHGKEIEYYHSPMAPFHHYFTLV